MSKYSLIEYESSWYDKWNSFIDNSNNGTLFHRLDFLSYHRDKYKKSENHIIWLKGQSVFAVMPLAIFEKNGKKIAKSPFGASFGGIVHTENLNLRQSIIIIELLDDYLKSKRIEEIEIVMPPLNYFKHYSGNIEYSLSRSGYNISNRDIFNIIVLNNAEKYWRKLFKGRARTTLRKVSDDFIIEENVSCDSFYSILVEDKKRNNAKPTHTLGELKLLKRMFPTDIFMDVAIHKESKLKSGICYFILKKDHTLMTFYIVQEDKAYGLNGTSVLIDNLVGNSINKGLKYIDFGSSSFGYEIKNLGLAFFKESFGARGFIRNKYTKFFN